jgi:hypothetical protein
MCCAAAKVFPPTGTDNSLIMDARVSEVSEILNSISSSEDPDEKLFNRLTGARRAPEPPCGGLGGIACSSEVFTRGVCYSSEVFILEV